MTHYQRSISVSARFYDLLKLEAELRRMSMKQIVECVVNRTIDIQEGKR